MIETIVILFIIAIIWIIYGVHNAKKKNKIKVIAVKPEGKRSYLIFDSIDKMGKHFKDLFNTSEAYFKMFKQQVQNKIENGEYETYSNKDLDDYNTIEIGTNYNYKETLEYKIVEMTEEQKNL